MITFFTFRLSSSSSEFHNTQNVKGKTVQEEQITNAVKLTYVCLFICFCTFCVEN